MSLRRAGLSFLYLSIVILVIYSFTASRLGSVWGRWSPRCVHRAPHDQRHAGVRLVTRRIRLVSATAATVLGNASVIALVRLGPLPRPCVCRAGSMRRLVMPEVITGLSLLLLFVAVDIDRGFWIHRHRPHHSLTACFVPWCCAVGGS